MTNNSSLHWAFFLLVAATAFRAEGTEPKPGEVLENSLKMKLVYVPPGEFEMGSPDSEKGRKKEEQLHAVRLSKGFYLGVHEVTIGQFSEFVRQTKYKTEAETDGQGGYGIDKESGKFGRNAKYTWRNPGFPQADDHPVVSVTWKDAVAFCEWLSAKEGKTYRLPTEAEWEYACRAGTKTAYSNGDDPLTLGNIANFADSTAKEKFSDWYWAGKATDGYIYTAPVGKFKPNAFGLYDMHGNVFEWCADWYKANYGTGESPAIDPTGPATGSDRVVRGSSFVNSVPIVRSASRTSHRPVYRLSYVGFRVARSP